MCVVSALQASIHDSLTHAVIEHGFKSAGIFSRQDMTTLLSSLPSDPKVLQTPFDSRRPELTGYILTEVGNLSRLEAKKAKPTAPQRKQQKLRAVRSEHEKPSSKPRQKRCPDPHKVSARDLRSKKSTKIVIKRVLRTPEERQQTLQYSPSLHSRQLLPANPVGTPQTPRV